MPLVTASPDITGVASSIGIFGRFQAVNLTSDHSLKGVRLLGQDLKGGVAVDIMGRVKIHGKGVHIPGVLISTVGLQEAAPGDLSDPGIVLKFV
jgi:hypothetical protein